MVVSRDSQVCNDITILKDNIAYFAFVKICDILTHLILFPIKSSDFFWKYERLSKIFLALGNNIMYSIFLFEPSPELL